MFRDRRGKNKQPIVEMGKSYLALDIGTEFVKAAICRLSPKGQIEIIGYERTPQKQNSMRGAMITNIDDVVNTADIAVGNAVANAEKFEEDFSLPHAAIIGIAGELIKSVTIVVNYEREDPDYEIDQEEINDVLEQIREQAYENARHEISEDTGIAADQVIEINTTINSTEIDGSKVDSPLGFTGKSITYRIYASFAPKIHIDALNKVLERLELQKIATVVEPYAVAIGAKNARKDNFSGIFIDVGGGTTDIALVQNGSIVGTNMFAFGGRVFTKRLEIDRKVDYLQAESYKIDYADQKTTKKESAEIKTAFAKDIPIWLDGVAISLSEFEDVEVYPSKIYLCGGGSMLPDINSGLLEYPWLKTLQFNKFPKVNFLFPNQVNDVIDLTRSASDPRDVTPLSLARMLLDYRA